MVPVEAEVKLTVKGALPEVLSDVKLATGGSSFFPFVQDVNTKEIMSNEVKKTQNFFIFLILN
jgi:hypothetical protein